MNEPTRGFRLRDGMTPVALSVVVNASLFALLARSFCASSLPEARYIAVELQPSVRVTAHAPSAPKPSIVIPLPAVAKPAPNVRPAQAVLAAKHQIGPPQREGDPPSREASADEPGPRIQYSASEAVGLPGGDAGSAGGSGGASSGGPGAYTGSGDGGGTSGGSGTPSGVPSVDRHVPAPRVNPSVSESPKPAPNGESRAARLVGQVRPAYPSDARDDGVEGTTVLSVSLDATGKVTSAKVVTSSGDRRLDRAAVEAVEKWSYSPCLKDGVPAASTVRVRVEFRLE